LDIPRSKAKNCWCSIDPHLYDGAMSVLCAFFALRLTNTFRIWQCSPFVCWVCMTKNGWHSDDTHINHIETVFVYTTIISHKWYTHYCHPILCFWIIPFHPRALLILNFGSTSINLIWARKDIALSDSCAFATQFMAYWSFTFFLINIAQHPHLSSCSSFSSNSMTYHKQFQIFQLCAPGLCGELCSWRLGLMQYNGCNSDRCVLGTDHSSYHSYDIPCSNFVCIWCF
jgi:hypothetical protein